jgi:predicted nucleic acid-binding protein
MVRAVLRRASVVVCRVTFAELAAAIGRAEREGVIDHRRRDAILGRLDADFSKLTIVEIRRATLVRVPAIVVKHALRGYDSVQLAAALAVQRAGSAVSFWSTDSHLVGAAQAEGLHGVIPR